jgi:hypothetical protein
MASFFETMPSIYESIAFRGEPLVDFRGGPLFFRLVFLCRSLALDLSLFCLSLFGHVTALDFILNKIAGFLDGRRERGLMR